ncbi:hypothetical protein [Microvirga aerophila]|jgi:hypothetical protein|uniref:RNA polymerase alpha subunit C-terminal domain-containing protein n=1 Tax=Microvirga aerophila TaxID=670291 RepID=A0A512C5C0_9HYPH|nr:hypothetical protein [Microvirga aerophila]GEO19418.1 hypothetical protein MAE02_71140 [Microvirga aerophila]
MEHAFYQRYEGPIIGLRLPRKTWNVLRRKNITTIDRLRAAAHRVHRFEGIGPKAARLIREEIARVMVPKEQPLEGLVPDPNNTHETA